MICSADVILILDTNVLLDVLATANGVSPLSLENWIKQTIETAECNVSGRSVIVLVSRKILSDYQTGFGREGRQKLGTAFRFYFEDNLMDRKEIHCRNGDIFMIPMIIRDSSSFQLPKRFRKMDKYDIRFLSAVDETLKLKRFANRLILFASNDRPTRNHVADYARVCTHGSDRVRCSDDVVTDLADH